MFDVDSRIVKDVILIYHITSVNSQSRNFAVLKILCAGQS